MQKQKETVLVTSLEKDDENNTHPFFHMKFTPPTTQQNQENNNNTSTIRTNSTNTVNTSEKNRKQSI